MEKEELCIFTDEISEKYKHKKLKEKEKEEEVMSLEAAIRLNIGL
jgi:hypothetical protein